jgi:hypothetical protein
LAYDLVDPVPERKDVDLLRTIDEDNRAMVPVGLLKQGRRALDLHGIDFAAQAVAAENELGTLLLRPDPAGNEPTATQGRKRQPNAFNFRPIGLPARWFRD